MSNSSSSSGLANQQAKGDTVTDLLASVEKVKVSKEEKPLNTLFDQPITTANLREKFLYTTFEIIAEMGADALSANELIKRTKSSKGALFHHFDTIDHLCIESLNFFRKHLSQSVPKDECKNLEEYISFLVEDTVRKRSNKQYYHLVNFFRDRALRDERYLEPLKQLFEVRINIFTDRIMQFLAPGSSRQQVMAEVFFIVNTVERLSLHRVLYQDPQAFAPQLKEFIKWVPEAFRKFQEGT